MFVRQPAPSRDHPRVGGGTLSGDTLAPPDGGPSPRGRGNLKFLGLNGNSKRTIPAWAGEPLLPIFGVNHPRDHPRVGGGTTNIPRSARPLMGPSPRGRGNLRRDSMEEKENGTIPAWAGEPLAFALSLRDRRDHPRVGGGTP